MALAPGPAVPANVIPDFDAFLVGMRVMRLGRLSACGALDKNLRWHGAELLGRM